MTNVVDLLRQGIENKSFLPICTAFLQLTGEEIYPGQSAAAVPSTHPQPSASPAHPPARRGRKKNAVKETSEEDLSPEELAELQAEAAEGPPPPRRTSLGQSIAVEGEGGSTGERVQTAGIYDQVEVTCDLCKNPYKAFKMDLRQRTDDEGPLLLCSRCFRRQRGG